MANVAGGVLLMIFKPIKIGDLITAQGETGVVKEIEIFTKKLITPNNKQVIIPKGPLSNRNITNFTSEGELRINHVIGVSYDDDIKKAKSVLVDVLNANSKVLKEPAPSVNVIELEESSINLAVRPYSTVNDYWDVYFSVLEESKEALDKVEIEIPYPHAVEIEKTIYSKKII